MAEAVTGIRDGKGAPEEEDRARGWEATVNTAMEAAAAMAAVAVMAVAAREDVVEPAQASGQSGKSGGWEVNSA